MSVTTTTATTTPPLLDLDLMDLIRRWFACWTAWNMFDGVDGASPKNGWPALFAFTTTAADLQTAHKQDPNRAEVRRDATRRD
eukprot:CAMPEP_0119480678 /NCGR_PEP_ID=MMETSP1344-20130328/9376_1 /TAXON_ID=236787 /ORGANISM="Florenciella parvula, Strain CCMP2471" /LENGTH=82 /DNA_ID=CAMNT_0007515009 /DNA_START=1183 /DNA_END=1430 /DNA_ORIENTATION=-